MNLLLVALVSFPSSKECKGYENLSSLLFCSTGFFSFWVFKYTIKIFNGIEIVIWSGVLYINGDQQSNSFYKIWDNGEADKIKEDKVCGYSN